MSHVSKYRIKIGDLTALKTALTKKGIEYREDTTVSMYGSNKVPAAIAFKLKGWRYECAVSKEGDIKYDHFGSDYDSMPRLGETIRDANKEAIMAKLWSHSTNFWENKNESTGVIKITAEF